MKEIERTWILNGPLSIEAFFKIENGDYIDGYEDDYEVEQFYVHNNEESELRFRKYKNYAEVTCKSGQGTVRDERNEEISVEMYDMVLKCMKNMGDVDVKHKKIVEWKIYDRYMRKYKDIVTIFYNNVNNGALYYVDVEFTNVEDMESFDINDYIDAKDIKEECDKSVAREYIVEDESN